jgi:hypothetical protein
MLALLLALPASQGQDEKKPPSAKEQYTALVKEYSDQQQQIIKEYQKTKGEEQQKHLERYFGLGKDYAEKFYKLAEDNPKDPAGQDALFWVIQNGAGSKVYPKAAEKVASLVAEMPAKDLTRRLATMRGGSTDLMDAVYKRAEKDAADAEAATLLAWVATTGYHMPIGAKATARLVEKYPEHEAIERVCAMLGSNGPPDAADTLKKILEKATKSKVKAAATLALARTLARQADSLGGNPAEGEKVAAEAEKYFTQATELAKDDAAVQRDVERELKILRTLRVGKEAPEVKGPDLDGKEFKLSDYRGKVVLIDFWGHW